MKSVEVAAGSSVLVLAGGGIDSSICMHNFRRDGIPFRALHIDYGQRASKLEWQSVLALANRFESHAIQLKLNGPNTFSPGEVRGRNSAFVFLGLMHLLPNENLICLGIHSGTPFYDCSEPFFELTAKAVAEQTDSQVRLIAPLLGLTKPEIVAFALKEDFPLNLTYSCQYGVDGGCGTCHSCRDRESLKC